MASSRRPSSSRQAAGCGVRLLALTDHDTLAGYREVIAAARRPARRLTLIPGVEINAIVTRDLGPLGGRAAHPRASGWTRTTRRSRPRSQASATSAGAVRADRRAAARARPADRRPARDARHGRRRRARPADRGTGADGRRATRRASRMPSGACSAGGCRRTCRAAGSARCEAIEAIRAAGGLPSLAHFSEAPARIEVVRELVDGGLGGLEVYYRSFDAPTVDAVGEVATTLGLVPTGGQRLPRRHGDLRRGARRPVGPARGRRSASRRRASV